MANVLVNKTINQYDGVQVVSAVYTADVLSLLEGTNVVLYDSGQVNARLRILEAWYGTNVTGMTISLNMGGDTMTPFVILGPGRHDYTSIGGIDNSTLLPTTGSQKIAFSTNGIALTKSMSVILKFCKW